MESRVWLDGTLSVEPCIVLGASDANTIGVPNQCVDESAHEQCILQVIDFFEEMRRFCAMAIHGIARVRPIPDVPLVERQP